MSQPDVHGAAERFTASPLLPRDEAGPVFAAPWQAQAFAMAVQLSAAGHFTWTEWTTALGAQLQAAAERGAPDDGSRYFEHWLAALENLLSAKGVAGKGEIDALAAAWERAAHATPHGKPILLENDPSPTG